MTFQIKVNSGKTLLDGLISKFHDDLRIWVRYEMSKSFLKVGKRRSSSFRDSRSIYCLVSTRNRPEGGTGSHTSYRTYFQIDEVNMNILLWLYYV